MKQLPYILIVVLAFGLGWCSRPSPVGDAPQYDTIRSEPIIVTTVRVDTQFILSPLSNCYVKVSGVQPRLDEVRVYPRTVYQTEYIYRDIVRKEKQKRWGVGLGAGYGVGKHGLSPVVAVTVNWNLWQW